MASKDKFRVAAGNEIPCPMPLVTTQCTEEANGVFQSIEGAVQTILKNHGIQPTSLQVQNLARRYYYGHQTLIIDTKDSDSSSWKAAATEIQQLINKALLGRSLTDLEFLVEIRNSELMY
ncbi:hypothetical protein G7Y89_g4552 [Cudoniella acicularis]|uniref:Uncharacterized protein n=1 Tax=Cudoniella acicularis TaxID=354080 RepID=A0A8H4W6K9_9HELO|nr:hypothetical protein G7Y89_g4552 [Cudoniella acicularis]